MTRNRIKAAAIACVLEDESDETNSTAVVKDSDLMPLYNVVQQESVDDVAINPELSTEQINEVKSLLKEYSDITASCVCPSYHWHDATAS